MDGRRRFQVGLAGTLATLVLAGAAALGITAASGAIGGGLADRSYDAVEHSRGATAPIAIDRSYDAVEHSRAASTAKDSSYDAVEKSRTGAFSAPVNNNHDMVREALQHARSRK